MHAKGSGAGAPFPSERRQVAAGLQTCGDVSRRSAPWKEPCSTSAGVSRGFLVERTRRDRTRCERGAPVSAHLVFRWTLGYDLRRLEDVAARAQRPLHAQVHFPTRYVAEGVGHDATRVAHGERRLEWPERADPQRPVQHPEAVRAGRFRPAQRAGDQCASEPHRRVADRSRHEIPDCIGVDCLGTIELERHRKNQGCEDLPAARWGRFL